MIVDQPLPEIDITAPLEQLGQLDESLFGRYDTELEHLRSDAEAAGGFLREVLDSFAMVSETRE